MRDSRESIRLCASAAALVVMLGLGLCRPAAGAERPATPNLLTDLHQLRDHGVIADVQLPSAEVPDRLVVLIQDAHVDYTAQKHIAQVLERLAAAHGLRLILVEGGHGDVSLAHLRPYATPDNRRALAERYLTAGLLAAQEYLELVSDHPLMLWGVEDPDRYTENLEQFLRVETVRPEAAAALAVLHAGVSELHARHVNASLQTFEMRVHQFEANTIPLTVYLRDLAEEADRVGIPMTQFPQLLQFLTIIQLEESQDLPQVAAEQRQVVERLHASVTAAELAPLAEAAREVQTAPASQPVFYSRLEQLMRSADISPDAYPNLTTHMHVLRLQADLNPPALLTELRTLQRAIRGRLITTRHETQIVELVDTLARLRRLIRLQWSPDDYQAYQEHPERLRVTTWLPILRELLARAGIKMGWKGSEPALQARLAEALRFYETVTARNAELVRRTLEKMEAEDQQVAALVIGGFHTDQVRELLAARDMPVAVVTPVTGDDPDPTLYHRVLRAKARLGHLHAGTLLGTLSARAEGPKQEGVVR